MPTNPVFDSPIDRPAIIGMLHLPPLPGSPRHRLTWPELEQFVLNDLDALSAGPVDGIMLENFGDTPFFPSRVPAITVAAMTRLASRVRQQWSGPLGINVLRNDGLSALAIAASVEADFIRVNVLTAARLTDQGIIQGIAHELLRERSRLDAENIRIWADVDVKHSAPLAPRSLTEEVEDLVQRGGADAVIVSGQSTGKSIDLEQLQTVRQAAPQVPLLAGSGVNSQTIHSTGDWIDGAIVGTSLKQSDDVNSPVLTDKVRRLMEQIKSMPHSSPAGDSKPASGHD